MKKIITTAAIMFCVISTDAQTSKVNYIQKDTIEILMYDSLGNEYHYNPPRIIIKRTEVGDPEYWKRQHRKNRRWDRISIGMFTIGTLAMWIIPNIK